MTTVPKHNKSYFTAKHSTSGSRRRKRRDAETTQATLAESEMETLPLYKSNKTVNISDKYSGNVSSVLLFNNYLISKVNFELDSLSLSWKSVYNITVDFSLLWLR